MKVLVLSDLHLEFHKDDGLSFIESLNTDVDVLVLAGDITKYYLISYVLGEFCKKI